MAETKTSTHALIGHNYTTPDLVAKVTGKAKYSEDFRAEGMLWTKLLLSPMPHARVTRLDTSAALAMPGVKAILTADDMPGAAAGATLGEGVVASAQSETGLTNEPLYEGEPILAVAAVDELTATEAIEKIIIEFEPLPFAVDPLVSLRPGGANARVQGNTWVRPEPPPRAAGAPPAGRPRPEIQEVKWTDQDFADAGDGQMPMGKPTDEWTFGNIEEGFAQADLVLDETFVSPSTGHQPLETRSAMAYWQNGKLYLHGSTQSTVQTVGAIARWTDTDAANVVLISEYTGGGFGSKIPGAISMAIPALLSKKANAPVMMRIDRETEHYIGRARSGIQSRIKVGFRKDGRITAIDLFSVGDNGAYDAQGDYRSTGNTISLCFQPLNMRFRGITVLTNTPPRTSQRAPGGMQGIALMEPVMAKAARQLGIDEVDIHRINAPEGKAKYGPLAARGQQAYVTSCFIKEALEKGVEVFNWSEKKARSGQRIGNKVRGSGVAISAFSGGSTGFDGLFIIRPDGKVQFQSGIGNHGTHSVIDVHRVAAEMIGVPWEQCEVVWGDTSKGLPWTSISAGSQTTHAMTRAAYAAGTDAVKKLQEIAAKTLGGNPDSYKVADGRVSAGGRSMTLAQAAQKAIELGGKYDGHELPEDINRFTRTSAAQHVGRGLMAVAKDSYPRDGGTQSYTVGFAEVEVDVETGKFEIVEFAAIADVGTVINPRSLQGQTFGGIMLGIGHAISQKWVYDQHYGVPLAKRFYQNKPPTILDKPTEMKFAALNLPDPETPVGARGVGEPPVGAGYGAILNAIAAAVGDEVFRRSPVTPDIILTALETGHVAHEPLTANI
jgi:CO/xanthine dehydrogenase Mo-binding subunit